MTEAHYTNKREAEKSGRHFFGKGNFVINTEKVYIIKKIQTKRKKK